MQECKKCGESKEVTKFSKCTSSTGKEYRIRTCNSCRKKRENAKYPDRKVKDLARLRKWKDERRGTIEGFIHQNLSRWRQRSTSPCNLTTEYLLGLWTEQSGLCYYTGYSLDTLKPVNGPNRLSIGCRDRYSPSLDKMDPKGGYVQGNVVWCSYSVNSMKGQLTDQQFLKVCQCVVKNLTKVSS